MTIDILEKVHEFLVHCKTRAKIPGHVGRSWRWVHVLMFLLSRVLALHAPVSKKSIRTVGGRRSYVAAVRHSERALVLQVTILASEAVRYDSDNKDPHISICGSPLSPPGASAPGLHPQQVMQAATRQSGRRASNVSAGQP